MMRVPHPSSAWVGGKQTTPASQKLNPGNSRPDPDRFPQDPRLKTTSPRRPSARFPGPLKKLPFSLRRITLRRRTLQIGEIPKIDSELCIMRKVWNVTAASQTPFPLNATPSITSANPQITARIISHPNSAPNSFPINQIGPSAPLFPSKFKSSCKTVKPTQTTCFQPLAALQSSLLQFQYFSTTFITKTLRFLNFHHSSRMSTVNSLDAAAHSLHPPRNSFVFGFLPPPPPPAPGPGGAQLGAGVDKWGHHNKPRYPPSPPPRQR